MWYQLKSDVIKNIIDGAQKNPVYDNLVDDLYRGVNPYDNFDYKQVDYDLYGWISAVNNKVYDIFDDYKPRFVIEVGTWLGMSALRNVSIMHEKGIEDPLMLCIDTWLGSAEHWRFETNEMDYNALRIQNGHPMLYYQFLANVMHMGAQDLILPFPQVSSVAALVLKRLGVQADAIYIDASHHYEDLLIDMASYWPLVKPGGVMFGDDFGSKAWPGVTQAVLNFAPRIAHETEEAGQRDMFWVFGKKDDGETNQ